MLPHFCDKRQEATHNISRWEKAMFSPDTAELWYTGVHNQENTMFNYKHNILWYTMRKGENTML